VVLPVEAGVGEEVEVDGLEGVVRKAAKASSRVRLNEQLQRECAVNVILCKPWLGAGMERDSEGLF
jgi:hypothetical protein